MSTPSSSSSSAAPEEEELRLPRPPGVIRRFWARHPLFADVLIAVAGLFLSLAPVGTIGPGPGLAPSATGALLFWGRAAIPLLAVCACLALLRRRQWPVTAFAFSLALGVAYLFAGVPVGGPLLLVTSYSLAVYRSARACWIALGCGIGLVALIALSLSARGVVTTSVALNTVSGEVILGLIGALLGINVGNRKRYLEAVIDRSRQLLVERDQHAALAAAAERARIAREMHDIVSHSLTVVVALSEGAAATADQDRARDASHAAAATARTALTEMRSMLGVLRDDDTGAPLAPMQPVEPAETVAAAQRAGFPVTLAVLGAAELAPAVAFALGRIVQEGTTNAMRHAPAATEISVRIDYRGDPVVVEVINDGVRPARADPGFGLRGLRERVAHAGGSVGSAAVGDRHWMLRAELPARSGRTV